ncbi:flagellar biosynthetic protein FliR [Cereibacter sphaeroides]|uniref:flagellar biosynthetic protein FliR n=1 Tax=Rhodobacterales TaxID=204455 RepID=UPI000BBF35FA|nr:MULTISPECIES: flagellar biosynthetic protein FliR [Paracoccaceae]MCE6961907.1 flagellar biosynthetic protein FliR [Cereibacter sphaeroides]MCE6970682.1 flagellar biosynthetic protein FliR [Cereibacter sphaeroides]MCE6975722.1 flagellar biosynthetic protein FliR [Cereibacter sphaeroides]
MDTLPGLDLVRLSDWAVRFLFAMLRIGAFLIASPAFGGRFVSLPVRIVATVVLTLPVVDRVALPPTEVLASLQALPMMAQEMAIGLSAGLVLTILFAGAALAGDRIASTAGLGFAAQVDPSAGGQTPVVAQIFGLSLTMVFLALDGHLAALRIVLESYETLPPGAPFDAAGFVGAGVAAGGRMFLLGLRIMMPVVSALILINVAIGVITRSAPQLNVFSFGFPVTMTATLVLLFLTAPGTMGAFETLVGESLTLLSDLLAGADGRG